jgi:cell wall-associated NlpC family hydrolase
VNLADVRQAIAAVELTEFQCLRDLNLYKTPACDSLVTQAAAGRSLRFVHLPDGEPTAVGVCLCDDDYPGWLAIADLSSLVPAPQPYRPVTVDAATIQQRLPEAIAFTKAAMAQPNHYLWGGTVAPNYDCSGLMQAAFRTIGVILPRDAYQQESFVAPVALVNLQPGDLIFFGTEGKTTHVALALGADQYIHSSGQAHGRNGIGLDSLTNLEDPVSAHYQAQLRGAGRVTQAYRSEGIPWPDRSGHPVFPD